MFGKKRLGLKKIIALRSRLFRVLVNRPSIIHILAMIKAVDDYSALLHAINDPKRRDPYASVIFPLVI